VAEVLAGHESLWVIGGGAVYAAFLPHADRLVVTDVDTLVAGDTWAPALDEGWVRETRTPADGWTASSSGLRFAVSQYVRSDGVGDAR
jgi:dihydrofolate reductase